MERQYRRKNSLYYHHVENGAIKFSQKREKSDDLQGFLKIINGEIKKALITTRDMTAVQENRVFACPPMGSTDTVGQYRAQMFHFQSGACGYFGHRRERYYPSDLFTWDRLQQR
jgi:hypothetical protein